MTTSLCALCVSYAEHVGLPRAPEKLREEISRRLSLYPVWARLGAGFSALCIFWLYPALMLRRFKRFSALSPDEKERLLSRLQRASLPFFRGAFLLVKPIILGACYGEMLRARGEIS